MTKLTEINEIEARAIERVAKVVQSHRGSREFVRMARESEVEKMDELIWGEDYEALVELLDDDADAIDQLAKTVIESAKVKKASK